MVLVNLVYVIRSDSFGGARVNFRDRMSTHLLIDIVMYTVIGLSHFGFPEVSLSLVVSNICNIKAFYNRT